MERRHWRKLLQHLCEQLLQVSLRLQLSWRQLLHLALREENRFQTLHDLVLLVIALIKASEQVDSLVTPEQIPYRRQRRFGQLRREQLPVAVLDLEEAHHVVCFEKHEADEAAVQLLVTFNLVLELATHMPVQLLLVHW